MQNHKISNMLLIADSGSTKTSWALVRDGRRYDFETPGINPVRDSQEDTEAVLRELESSIFNFQLSIVNSQFSIRFYGAGCIPPYSTELKAQLHRHFPAADIRVESDLLGAAHALCGRNEGIACILGTGSNSCLYDGEHIVRNVPPLGYILGDEGSGAALGKHLVGDLLKGQTSPRLLQAFLSETGLTPSDVIRKVYRQPQPNRFLASLVPFLGRHRHEAEVHRFLVAEFRQFFRRNVAPYRRPDLPVHFVGGVAHTYRAELLEAARLEGFHLGQTLLRPIDAMVAYEEGIS